MKQTGTKMIRESVRTGNEQKECRSEQEIKNRRFFNVI